MALLATLRAGAASATRPTVLLHGFLGSSKNLRGFAQRWGERQPERAFLLVDLTGHGASPPLPPGADLDTLARDVAETVEAAGLGAPPEVLGHSLGGRVALAWARQRPQGLASIVLLDIAPGPIEPARASSRRVLDVVRALPAEAPDRRGFKQLLVDGGLAPGVADWVLMNVDCDGGGCRWRIDREALAALEPRANGADLWPVVEGGVVPVRAIRAARSAYVRDEDARRFVAAGVRVDTIDAGHDLHVEAPAAVVDLISGS